MRVVLLLATAVSFAQLESAQFHALSPIAEFDLHPGVKPHEFGKYARAFLAVTPNGMTLVTIGENSISLTAANLDGRVVNSKTDLVSVNAQIYAALTRSDGSIWLLSRGPHGLSQEIGVVSDLGNASPAGHAMGFRPSDARTNYTQMDLYSPAGEHLAAARLLASVAGAENPVAATNDEIVLRTEELRGAGTQTLFHFGSIVDGKFSERKQVKLVPPVVGGIHLMAPNGNFILIDKASGNRMTINAKTMNVTVVPLTKPAPVSAAAADSDYVYLLSGNIVLKTDSTGQVISNYQLQFSRGFVPAALGVTGKLLFLVNNAGHGERFQLE